MARAFDPGNRRQAAGSAADAERRRQLMIRRIDAALARIEDGEYGYCIVCGQQIAATRLDCEPTADCCADCARRSAAAAS